MQSPKHTHLAGATGQCLRSSPEGSVFFGGTAGRSEGGHQCAQMVKAQKQQLQGQQGSPLPASSPLTLPPIIHA